MLYSCTHMAKVGVRGLTNLTSSHAATWLQNYTLHDGESTRKTQLSCAIEIVSTSFAVWAQCTSETDRQTDRPRNGN